MRSPLILFDLIGTLVDEASDYEALDLMMAEVQARYALDVPITELSGSFTLAFMEIIRSEPDDDDEPAGFLPFREVAPDIFAGLMAHHGIEVDDADKTWFWDTYRPIQQRSWRLHPEVPKVLAALAEQGHRIAICSDADRYLVEDVVEVTELDRWTDVWVSAEEVGHVKPHPKIFTECLKRCGVPGTDVVFVGDSYERDIVGAAEAGIKLRVLVDRHDAREVPVTRILDLRALPGVLKVFQQSSKVQTSVRA